MDYLLSLKYLYPVPTPKSPNSPAPIENIITNDKPTKHFIKKSRNRIKNCLQFQAKWGKRFLNRNVAQPGLARLTGGQKVRSSNLRIPTIFILNSFVFRCSILYKNVEKHDIAHFILPQKAKNYNTFLQNASILAIIHRRSADFLIYFYWRQV